MSLKRWVAIILVANTACQSKHATVDAGVKLLEIRLGEPVGSHKGSVWPMARSGKPLSMHGVEGPAALTVRLPSGRVWSAKPVHSVIFSANETNWTLRSVHVVYEQPPLSWPEAKARVFALATELGVPPEQQALTKERLEAMSRGPDLLHPTFPVEGCIVLTTTILARSPGWIVTPNLGVVTPDIWKVYETWPETCR